VGGFSVSGTEVRSALFCYTDGTSIQGPRRIHAALGRSSSIPAEWSIVQGESYVLKHRTVGVSSDGGERVCVFIPENTVITVLETPLDGKTIVNVKWADSTAMVFVGDLLKRGKLIHNV
jgi:hypothetical protein